VASVSVGLLSFIEVPVNILKVWWQDATLFVYFSDFITYIQSHSNNMYIYPSPFTGASLHLLIACKLSWKNLPCGAEPRIELGPALSYSKPKRYTNICNS
jgi:hypothetical protein